MSTFQVAYKRRDSSNVECLPTVYTSRVEAEGAAYELLRYEKNASCEVREFGNKQSSGARWMLAYPIKSKPNYIAPFHE